MAWGKREVEIQTEVDTIGFGFPPLPTAPVYWPSAEPPTYVSWGKRQDEAEPTEVPEVPDDGLPEDPGDPEDPEGPIEIPPFPVPTQPNSIGINPPTATVIWGRSQGETDPEDPEPTTLPSFPAPTQPNSIGIEPPTATVIWGKREDDAQTLETASATVIWSA